VLPSSHIISVPDTLGRFCSQRLSVAPSPQSLLPTTPRLISPGRQTRPTGLPSL
jgi:hypothetical protein